MRAVFKVKGKVIATTATWKVHDRYGTAGNSTDRLVDVVSDKNERNQRKEEAREKNTKKWLTCGTLSVICTQTHTHSAPTCTHVY